MTPLPATIFAQAQSIQAEKQRRVVEHQARIAARARMESVVGQGVQPSLNLIAQGDSWFDYPFPAPVINQSDIVAHLKRLPAMAPEVLSLAHHGEAAENMLGVRKLDELLFQLKNPANGEFDAILFSGGGNDLAGDQFRLWTEKSAAVQQDPRKGLNEVRVSHVIGIV